MHLRREHSISIVSALPSFAEELENVLTQEGSLELASQIRQLMVVQRCHCEDDFCSTFYTGPKPEGSYGADHCTVVLSPENGMVNVDVAEGKIACVEALYRNDVKERLQVLMP